MSQQCTRQVIDLRQGHTMKAGFGETVKSGEFRVR
jgi:hypothetical protein